MKKSLLIGAAIFTSFTLAACSNSKSPKQTYIDNYSSLSNQSKNYNSQDITIKFESFDMQGEAASEDINKLFDNSSLNIKANVDYENKAVAVNTETKISDQDVKLNMLLGKEGIYFENSQIKSLIDQFQTENPYIGFYGALLGQLEQKYLLIDSKSMESGMASQTGADDTWSTTYNQLFKESKVNKEEIEKNFKDIPEKAFTKSGDKTTMKLSGDGDDVLAYLKKSLTDTNKAQIQPMIDNLEKYTDIKSLDVETTLNAKTHESEAKIRGNIQSKDGKTSAQFKISTTAKASKAKASITEPTAKDAMSVSQLLSGLNDAMTDTSQDVNVY